MRCNRSAAACLLIILTGLPLSAPGMPAIRVSLPEIDLGDIPARPVAPEFAFERFFRTTAPGQLQFAPDDRAVYFLRNDGQVDNVFALDLESRALRQVTRLPEAVSGFGVDHRGRFLILLQDTGGDENHDLYRFDLATGELRRLTTAGAGDTTMACGLSPDDTLLYYAQTRNGRSEAGLWQVEVATGRTRELVPGNGRTLDCDAVSADGRYLLFGELIGFDERRLGLLDLATGATRYISAAPGINNLDGDFAGDQVYFRSAAGADRFRLWRYRIAEDALEQVELPVASDLESLSLYADGRVVVITYRTAFSTRATVFVDGFDAPVDFGLPPEMITDAVFSDTDPEPGIVLVQTASMPGRYYRVGGGAPVLLYDANRSGIDSKYFSQVRSVRIPSFDGLGIPVHLFIPNGTSAGNPRPVIVLVHGGPEAHIDPLYSSVIQFLTNRGFIVVAPNVRGSSGFGRWYAALDDNDWGGGHVRDLMAVANAVRELDFADPQRLFLVGMSFGGFSVMSLITQYPDTFRAAVDFFGFTELASFVDSWPRFLQQHLTVELGFDPRRDRIRNWWLSPLYHADRIRIPLQIHQGANDIRVPRAQSDWLVHRLRGTGRTVEYFVYPDEGHGFTHFENERLAYRRLVAFLRRQ
ncbi:MAG: alpha/beta fold hydrolase [Gammaproteobacteria bacterium]|jgi:dipeptidyl aminopeptidase/acylaminoacyl peptidase